MIDLKILRRAVFLGVILEVSLVIGGAVWPSSRYGLLFGAMLISAVAGFFYARELGKGFGAGLLGGTLTGAACGVVAVVGAAFAGIEHETYIPYGVMVLTLTGAVGGIFGELDHRLRAYIIRKLSADNSKP
jgi:hypothetical protein